MSFNANYHAPVEDLINLESKKDNTLITTQAFRTKSVNNVQVDVTSEKDITIDVSAFGFTDISDVNASIVSSTNLTVVNFDGTNLTVQSTTNGKSRLVLEKGEVSKKFLWNYITAEAEEAETAGSLNVRALTVESLRVSKELIIGYDGAEIILVPFYDDDGDLNLVFKKKDNQGTSSLKTYGRDVFKVN